MRSRRALGVCVLIALAALTAAAPAARADGNRHRWLHGQHNAWYGGYNCPEYWNYGTYNSTASSRPSARAEPQKN